MEWHANTPTLTSRAAEWKYLTLKKGSMLDSTVDNDS